MSYGVHRQMDTHTHTHTDKHTDDMPKITFLGKCNTFSILRIAEKVKNLAQPATTETVTSEETAAPQQPTIAEEMRALIPISQNHSGNGPRQDSSSPALVDQDNRHANPTQICPFYRRGTCRHGISGGGCSKLHPSPSQKLLTHGIRHLRGCNRGAQCDKFHPKMCPPSLNNRVCLSESCKLWHVGGNRRTPFEHSVATHRPDR